MAVTKLVPVPVEIGSPIFAAIKEWAFEDEFVARILADDIPQRVAFGIGRVWAYEDPVKNLVGFGTLDICEDYAALTGGKPHTFIPLLAVHPDHHRKGYGRAIVDHLVGEAACTVRLLENVLDTAVLLDVYEESAAARGLYQKCGFMDLSPEPLVDPANGKRYRIMAKRVG